MAFFHDGLDRSSRRARAEMESAAQKAQPSSKAVFQEKLLEETGDEKFARTYRSRGRLYDKIHVSLRTMDIIVGVVAALLVITIIIGIILG